jgi:hypothetical protein
MITEFEAPANVQGSVILLERTDSGRPKNLDRAAAGPADRDIGGSENRLRAGVLSWPLQAVSYALARDHPAGRLARYVTA